MKTSDFSALSWKASTSHGRLSEGHELWDGTGDDSYFISMPSWRVIFQITMKFGLQLNKM